MSQIPLKDIQPGEQGVLCSYGNSAKAYRHRLMAMGLTLGTVVKVIRRAPFGDPVEIDVRGTRLGLRQSEASELMLERCDVSE